MYYAAAEKPWYGGIYGRFRVGWGTRPHPRPSRSTVVRDFCVHPWSDSAPTLRRLRQVAIAVQRSQRNFSIIIIIIAIIIVLVVTSIIAIIIIVLSPCLG